jgi:hypothetical protein
MQDGSNIHRGILMETFIQTRAEYEFYTPEIFAGYDALTKAYESKWIAYLSSLRDAEMPGGDTGGVLKQNETALEGFVAALGSE